MRAEILVGHFELSDINAAVSDKGVSKKYDNAFKHLVEPVASIAAALCKQEICWTTESVE